MPPTGPILLRAARFRCFEELECRRLLATGPYAPAAGQPDSTALHLEDPAFAAWASGYQEYQPGEAVDPVWQTPFRALGRAVPDSADVVSLGRGGEITLTFDLPIRNGPGADFAVFENAFADQFLELAFVEVSSDGVNYWRMPNDSRTAEPVGPFGEIDPTQITGYAGKYRLEFGTPFDLSDLADAGTLLDLNRITHVRIIDIVGDGSATDSQGDPVYDPYPTSGSAGLDLEAVGVIHVNSTEEAVVGFEDLGVELPAGGHFNGPVSDGERRAGIDGDTVVVGEFKSGGVGLNNIYSEEFESWVGWAYSKATDTTTPGFGNQFSAFAGGGAEDSETYAVAFRDTREGEVFVDRYPLPTLHLTPDANGAEFRSLAVTNTTYTALSMLNGDAFAKKFGGPSGDDPDWFLLTIEGFGADSESVGTLDFYLADYRFSNNSLDYVIDEWTTIDVASLKGAHSLQFKLTSSDVGLFGMNTPSLFALDNVVLATDVTPPPTLTFSATQEILSEGDAPTTSQFEDVGAEIDNESFYNGADGRGGFVSMGVRYPNQYSPTFGSWSGWSYSNQTDTTTPGFSNQYSAFAGGGALGSSTYGVAFAGAGPVSIELTGPTEDLQFRSVMVTNATYPALSMFEGDPFAKKFGGQSGDDPDFFRLTIEGHDGNGESVGSVETYLADYRFDNSAEDYVLDEWLPVDLSSLQGARRLSFHLDSTDNGAFGMNTPAYFALDHLLLSDGGAATGAVTRSGGDLSNPLTVHLTSSDRSEVSLPQTVLIPPNRSTATFPLLAVDDSIVDGEQSVELAASGVGYTAAIKQVQVTDNDAHLVVSELQVEPDGVSIEFSAGFDPAVFNLFDRSPAAGGGSADLQIRQAGGELVAGSAVIDAAAGSLRFVKSDGLLEAGNYEVRLRAAADGVKTLAGNVLDGDANGSAGGVFVQTFSVAEPEPSTRVVSLPNLVRGPGQIAEVPAGGGVGIPLAISDAEGVTRVETELRYDVALLQLDGVSVASGMPPGATATLTMIETGLARILFESPIALAVGEQAIVNLFGSVPEADNGPSVYGATHLLELSSLTVSDASGLALPSVADNGLHLASYPGDVSGNRRVNANDASLVARFAGGLDGAFAVSLLADPVVVADISGNGRVNALDASLIAQFVALFPTPQVPPIPEAEVAMRALGSGPNEIGFRLRLTGHARPHLDKREVPATESGRGMSGLGEAEQHSAADQDELTLLDAFFTAIGS